MVNRWVRGLQTPETESCQRLADALGVDVDEVLEAAGHRPPEFEDDSPQVRELLTKLRRIQMTEERYLLLAGQLELLQSLDKAAGRKE